VVNFDPANDGVDDLAHALPVESFEALTDLGGERFQPADDERQLAFGVSNFSGCPLLFLELRHAQPQPSNARFELSLVDEAASIAVDEAIDPAPKRRHLAIEPHDLLWRASSVGRLSDASAVLVRHAARIFQQCPHLIPHHLLESIAAHGWIAAFGRAGEPVHVRADAAVVMARALRAIGWRERRRLGVVGIAAAAANRQALQQPTRALSALALALAVLVELRSRRLECGRINQGQHRNLDPFLARTHDTPRGARHRSRIAPDQAQPLSCRHDARPPEHGAANISRIGEHAANRRDAPIPQTPRAFAAHALQTSAYLAQAQPIESNPGKDATHDVGLVLDDLEAGHSAALIAADVAISERRARQRADRARTGSMQATASNALENLGALVLGDDALNLQQEIILRRAADRAVQEYHLGPGAAKLLDQQDLMGMASCQPVGRMHIDALDMAAGNRIAQLLQCRTLKVRAAAPIIHIAVIRLKLEAINGDALLQRRDLTVDRMIARLRIARYSRVECDRAALAHASLLRRFVAAFGAGSTLPRVGASRVRRITGTRRL